MARLPGTRIRVAVLNPARRTVVVYGNAIGEHEGMVAVNCDDGRALYVHPVNVRYLERTDTTKPLPTVASTTRHTGSFKE